MLSNFNDIVTLAKKQGFIKARVANFEGTSFLLLAMPYQIATKAARKYFGLFACHDNYKYSINKCKELRKELAMLYKVKDKSLRIICNSQDINEKKMANSCGLGFYAKNSLIIIEPWGSFFTLILLELPINLPSHQPLETSSILCHNCNLCQLSCPHGALQKDYSLNIANCEQEWISRGHDNAKITQVYGCDKCQNCCPYNKEALHYYEAKASEASEDTWTNLANWQDKNVAEVEAMLKPTLLGYKWLAKAPLLKNVERILARRDELLSKKDIK